MANLVSNRQISNSAMLDGSPSGNLSSSRFDVASGNYVLSFTGSYTVSSARTLDAGTVTGITIYERVVGSDGSTNLATVGTISGLSLDAAYVYDLIDTGAWVSLREMIYAGDDVIGGSRFNDVLFAYAGNDSISGGDGNDLMLGGDGHDTLVGGYGRDTLVGGAGNDVYYVDRTLDSIFETADAGQDTVFSSATFTLNSNVETLTLTGTAAIRGTGNELANSLTGNSANNVLSGLDGDDTLNGGGGSADTLDGGTGNDLYIVDTATDVILDAAGVDTVQSTVSYSLSTRSTIENLILVGGGNLSGTGNSLANTIVSNAGDTTINGGLGSDTASYAKAASAVTVALVAGAQNTGGAGTDTLLSIENLEGSRYGDSLAGDSGANFLSGLAGNDTLLGGGGADLLDGGFGNDSLDGGAGVDTAVYASASAGVRVSLSRVSFQDTVGAGSDKLVSIENIVGSAHADWFVGNAANNQIDGGQGNDTMYGGGGNDTYIVDSAEDRVVEYQGAGTDLIRSSVSFDLSKTPGVENLTLTGTDDINATGNKPSTAGNGNNVLIGNSGANVLDGLDGADKLSGIAGDDILNGGADNDTLSGGIGNDQLDGGSGRDTLAGGDGADKFLFTTELLSSNIDRITDFQVGIDKIGLGGGVFVISNVHDNSFDEENFRIINGLSSDPADDGVVDANDRIIYDDATGRLYYDSDGSGAAAMVQFAQLTAGLKLEGLSHADFEMI